MKPASPALQSLLASGSFVMAELYTVTLAGGGVLRYTGADIDIADGGNLWSSGGPRFDRASAGGRLHWKPGLDVDTLELAVLPRPGDLLLGQPWLAALRAGALDGAELQLDRAFLPGWTPPLQVVGTVTLFVGRIAEVEAGRSAARLAVNSHLELLGTSLPRNLYGPGCRHTLFDAGCALSSAPYAAGGAVVSVAGNGNFTTTGLTAFPAGYFDLGRLTMTSGANAGQSRMIASWSGAAGGWGIALASPLPSALQAGDAFTAYPGCDKTLATCRDKFANLANFGGFPFIPTPETAV